jgi:hypothetical protein
VTARELSASERVTLVTLASISAHDWFHLVRRYPWQRVRATAVRSLVDRGLVELRPSPMAGSEVRLSDAGRVVLGELRELAAAEALFTSRAGR